MVVERYRTQSEFSTFIRKTRMEQGASIGVAMQPRRHVSSGGDRVTSGSGDGRQRRTSTREKIARMVAEGASNYPSYLKLIYTGDSEEPSSSEDELGGERRTSGRTASSGSAARRGRGNAAPGDGGTTSSVMDKERRQTAKTTTASPSTQVDSNNCQCHLDSKQ